MHPEDNFSCRCRLPTKKTDFQPYCFDATYDEDLLFYHVYDSQSQTPFLENIGILAGTSHPHHHNHDQRRPRHKQAYKHRITQASIAAHLDPHNRSPTPFISLYADEDAAWREAQRRLREQREVWQPTMCRWQARGEVRIAVLGAKQMSEAGVFYFSGRQLVGPEMLDLRRPSCRLRRLVRGEEWFAMDWIPCSAMEGFVEPEQDDEEDECMV